MVLLALSRSIGRRWTGANSNRLRSQLPAISKRCFHFASQDYAACFRNLPEPDTASLRAAALEYMDSFDPQLWYNEPVRL